MSRLIKMLEEARKLIEDPSRHCVGHLAEDADGNPCRPEEACAVKWCAAGCVRRVGHDLSVTGHVFIVGDILELLDGVSGIPETEPGSPRPIAMLNDTASHTQVLAAFDAAMAKVNAEGL